MIEIYIALGGLVFGVVLALLILPKLLKKGPTSTSIHTSIERVREMGDLVALTAHVKEVVTEQTDPGFFFSNEKMILICEFDVEYRYNLRKAQIIKDQRSGDVLIAMPQIKPTVSLKDFNTYDKTSGRFLGVLPIGSDASAEDALRKRAIDKAKTDASALGEDLRDKIEASATRTLQILCAPITAGTTAVTFADTQIAQPKLDTAEA